MLLIFTITAFCRISIAKVWIKSKAKKNWCWNKSISTIGNFDRRGSG